MPAQDTRAAIKASPPTISAPKPRMVVISEIVATVGERTPYDDGPIPVEYRELHGSATMRSPTVYLVHATRPGPAN